MYLAPNYTKEGETNFHGINAKRGAVRFAFIHEIFARSGWKKFIRQKFKREAMLSVIAKKDEKTSQIKIPRLPIFRFEKSRSLSSCSRRFLGATKIAAGHEAALQINGNTASR